jgi:hypothetical protein
MSGGTEHETSLLDTMSRKMQYAKAAFNSPLRFRLDGKQAVFRLREGRTIAALESW